MKNKRLDFFKNDLNKRNLMIMMITNHTDKEEKLKLQNTLKFRKCGRGQN